MSKTMKNQNNNDQSIFHLNTFLASRARRACANHQIGKSTHLAWLALSAFKKNPENTRCQLNIENTLWAFVFYLYGAISCDWAKTALNILSEVWPDAHQKFYIPNKLIVSYCEMIYQDMVRGKTDLELVPPFDKTPLNLDCSFIENGLHPFEVSLLLSLILEQYFDPCRLIKAVPVENYMIFSSELANRIIDVPICTDLKIDEYVKKILTREVQRIGFQANLLFSTDESADESSNIYHNREVQPNLAQAWSTFFNARGDTRTIINNLIDKYQYDDPDFLSAQNLTLRMAGWYKSELQQDFNQLIERELLSLDQWYTDLDKSTNIFISNDIVEDEQGKEKNHLLLKAKNEVAKSNFNKALEILSNGYNIIQEELKLLKNRVNDYDDIKKLHESPTAIKRYIRRELSFPPAMISHMRIQNLNKTINDVLGKSGDVSEYDLRLFRSNLRLVHNDALRRWDLRTIEQAYESACSLTYALYHTQQEMNILHFYSEYPFFLSQRLTVSKSEEKIATEILKQLELKTISKSNFRLLLKSRFIRQKLRLRIANILTDSIPTEMLGELATMSTRFFKRQHNVSSTLGWDLSLMQFWTDVFKWQLVEHLPFDELQEFLLKSFKSPLYWQLYPELLSQALAKCQNMGMIDEWIDALSSIKDDNLDIYEHRRRAQILLDAFSICNYFNLKDRINILSPTLTNVLSSWESALRKEKQSATRNGEIVSVNIYRAIFLPDFNYPVNTLATQILESFFKWIVGKDDSTESLPFGVLLNQLLNNGASIEEPSGVLEKIASYITSNSINSKKINSAIILAWAIVNNPNTIALPHDHFEQLLRIIKKSHKALHDKTNAMEALWNNYDILQLSTYLRSPSDIKSIFLSELNAIEWQSEENRPYLAVLHFAIILHQPNFGWEHLTRLQNMIISQHDNSRFLQTFLGTIASIEERWLGQTDINLLKLLAEMLSKEKSRVSLPQVTLDFILKIIMSTSQSSNPDLRRQSAKLAKSFITYDLAKTSISELTKQFRDDSRARVRDIFT